jgi:5-methylthioadenosine/S-adenosylhomocysteine deaminase
MKNVDLILKNANILVMDSALTHFTDGAVAVRANKIEKVGLTVDILKEYHSEGIVDCGGKVLMPGLVNAHTHIPMTLLRGLADDLRLDVWLMGYMMPVEREFVTPEFVRLGSLLACAEMIRSGVTSFADMYYFEEEIAKTVAEVGMRAVCSQTVMKFPTPDAKFYEESLEATRGFIKRWKNNDLIVPSVAPHAPYTCPPEILKACAHLALEFDVPLHTHLAETCTEVENMRKEQGMPVIPYVKKQGLLEAKVIAAHCVCIDEGEIRTLQHAGAGVAHNPSSNMKLASGIAPVKKMLEQGVNVGIGTDGPASNNDLDMFEEMRLASFLGKGTSGDPTALPAHQILLMATRIGAQALHIGHITGSLEPGKRADLILVDLSSLHNLPHFTRDPHSTYAQMVYSAKASDVTDVMVNGKWLMQSRKLLTINEDEVRNQAQEYAVKIDHFLIQREQSVLAKLIAIGGATEEESFEVQAKLSIADPDKVMKALHKPAIHILRERHYREYDNYFTFKEPEQGLIRYREDHFIDETGNVTNVRCRLTHLGETVEDRFPQKVLLSRSRFLAPASQSLRFYQEYFKPSHQVEIDKDRQRFLISYKNTEFFINIDRMFKPKSGFFVEIKSRTWSREDAVHKSKLAVELIKYLGEDAKATLSEDYFEMINTKPTSPES